MFVSLHKRETNDPEQAEAERGKYLHNNVRNLPSPLFAWFSIFMRIGTLRNGEMGDIRARWVCNSSDYKNDLMVVTEGQFCNIAYK